MRSLAATLLIAATVLVSAAHCRRTNVKHYEAEAPIGSSATPQEREHQRLDQSWRQSEESPPPGAATEPRPQPIGIQFVYGEPETFRGLDGDAINRAPVSIPIRADSTGPSVLKAQVYLDRIDFSVGVLDGTWGRNSEVAVWWFQRAHGLEPTGDVDEPTFRLLAALGGAVPPLVAHRLAADELKGPFVQIPENIYDKAKLDCLCYQSVQEKLSESFHTTPEFLQFLNPDKKFSKLTEGDMIVVPNVRPAVVSENNDIASVVVSIRGHSFNGYDARGALIFHAPTTVGSKYDPSPHETVHVDNVVQDPGFHYQPALFHDVPHSEPDAHLAPGPKSPVGVVWIALSKPHYGIHGTADPESIGYVSSHGCVRLTNWDAEEVAHRIGTKVPVSFVDTRRT